MRDPVAGKGRRRLVGRLAAAASLLFVIGPAADLFAHPHPRAVIAVTVLGVAVFLALHMWFWMTGRDLVTIRPQLATIAVLFVLSSGFVAAYGSAWTTTAYLAVTTVAVGLRQRWRLELAGVTAMTALAQVPLVWYLTRTHQQWWDLSGVQANWSEPWYPAALFGVGACFVIVTRLATVNAELRQARTEIARLAATQERLRIARDLHDLLGRSLTSVVLTVRVAMRRRGDAAALEQDLTAIESVAQSALAEVRAAVSGYRSADLGQELAAARATLQAAGIAAAVDEVQPELPAELAGVIGLVIREGVTNVVRHSDASWCSVRLSRENGTAAVEVLNDRARSAELRFGNGLTGMRERVQERRGVMEAEPLADGGFRLKVTVPA